MALLARSVSFRFASLSCLPVYLYGLNLAHAVQILPDAAHLPVLTVRETLQFSRTCQQSSAEDFSAVKEIRKLQQTGSKAHSNGAGMT